MSHFAHHAQSIRKLLPEPRLTEYFTAAYNQVLVLICGARGTADEQGFLAHHLDPTYPTTEWRFGGSLGFGGKFRTKADLTLKVDCYPEDETPERRQTINQANEALRVLREQFLPGVAELDL